MRRASPRQPDDWLRGQFPGAAAVASDAVEGILACTALPQAHWRTIWSTNHLSVNRLPGHAKSVAA